MWNRIQSWLKPSRSATRKASPTRRLQFQALESRALMAGIPALSSLPGAARSIYLDFNGHFQATWNRTDSGQQYTNVSAGQFNIDNTAGISDAEALAIRKIWETVADDYAPFNVNVTTVVPTSFANGVALRVVMAGDCSATLRTGANSTINVSGDRFIANSSGQLVDTSGYAAINSFTNAEPNVVYVFAKYMSTWGNIDSEGHFRDLRAMIATTASHEAGHSFGLVHHGDYDVGSGITTPIMGANTQGDRTIWSKYTVGSTTHDNLAKLTQVFGARADDFGGSYNTAPTFQFPSYSPLFGWRGTMRGIIGRETDTDMFRITVNSTTNYNFNLTVPQFGNLDAKLALYRVTRIPLVGFRYETVAFADPGISSITPFQGLGASFSLTLQPGTYAVAVRSHGGFGDLGNYTLSIGHSSIVINDPIVVNPGPIATTSGFSSPESTSQVSNTLLQPAPAAGAGAAMPLATPQVEKANLAAKDVDEVLQDWAADFTAIRRRLRLG